MENRSTQPCSISARFSTRCITNTYSTSSSITHTVDFLTANQQVVIENHLSNFITIYLWSCQRVSDWSPILMACHQMLPALPRFLTVTRIEKRTGLYPSTQVNVNSSGSARSKTSSSGSGKSKTTYVYLILSMTKSWTRHANMSYSVRQSIMKTTCRVNGKESKQQSIFPACSIKDKIDVKTY